MNDIIKVLVEVAKEIEKAKRVIGREFEIVKEELLRDIIAKNLLYKFPDPRQPSIEQLYSLIRKYMVLENEDLRDYITRIYDARKTHSDSRINDK